MTNYHALRLVPRQQVKRRAASCCHISNRAGNKPSQRLKLHKHRESLFGSSSNSSSCHISKWCLVPGSLINPIRSPPSSSPLQHRTRTFTNYVISHIIPRCSTHQDRRVKIIMDYWSWRGGGVVVRVGWLNLEMYISTLTTDWPRPHSSTTDFSTVWLRW